jgi:hypothetical protein
LVEHVEACGILPFSKIFASDHRPLYVDFNVFTLFGHPDFGTEKAALRDLQLHNPRLIDAYEESLCQQLVNHNVEFRVTVLFQLKEQQWTNHAEYLFNEIDRDIKEQCNAPPTNADVQTTRDTRGQNNSEQQPTTSYIGDREWT